MNSRIQIIGHPECGHELRVLKCGDELPRLCDVKPDLAPAQDLAGPEAAMIAHGMAAVWQGAWGLPFNERQQWVTRVMGVGWIKHPMLGELFGSDDEAVFGHGGFFGLRDSHPATWSWITADPERPDTVFAITTCRVQAMWAQYDPAEIGPWESSKPSVR